jgi:AbrB family looped-hinge helix DNA binding protein
MHCVEHSGGAMKTIIGSVTQRGQITIPAEVRKVLGVKPGSKLAFEIADDQVRLVPLKYTLETAFRSVSPLPKPISDKEMSRIAIEERAQEIARKMRQQ